MIKLTYILFTLALMSSCKTSVSNVDKENTEVSAKKDFIVISAEKSRWVGGRQGVGGDQYTVVVKNNQREISYQFLSLTIGSEKLPVKTSLNGNVITIVAMKTDPFKQRNVDDLNSSGEIPSQANNKSDYYIEYTLGKNKTVKKLKIDSFKEADTP